MTKRYPERITRAAPPAEPVLPGDGAGMAVRLLLGLALGALITLALFWGMQYLIGSADRSLDEEPRTQFVDFVRVQRAEELPRRQPKPRKPPPPQVPPPEPPQPRLDEIKPSPERLAIADVRVDTPIDLTAGFNLGVGEGDYLPIVKVAPIYPRRAQQRGIEGYCVVQYTITRLGTVKDVSVVESECTSSLFKRASVRAALKFKYKPRVIDGDAVEVNGVRNKFIYTLQD